MFNFKGSARKLNVEFQACSERDKGMKQKFDQKWNRVKVDIKTTLHSAKIIPYVKKMSQEFSVTKKQQQRKSAINIKSKHVPSQPGS